MSSSRSSNSNDALGGVIDEIFPGGNTPMLMNSNGMERNVVNC